MIGLIQARFIFKIQAQLIYSPTYRKDFEFIRNNELKPGHEILVLNPHAKDHPLNVQSQLSKLLIFFFFFFFFFFFCKTGSNIVAIKASNFVQAPYI